ncbi:hypothetical protein KBT16_20875 [Nostoc sp. CCCryo 231-06]|nr:hypothetical protein [Nostoc sp. CCCryo 231-06]
MIIHNGSYIWFHAGQTARWGTINAIHELILYGYEVKILPAKKETISPIEWME